MLETASIRFTQRVPFLLPIIEDFTVTHSLHPMPCEGCLHQAKEAINYARITRAVVQEKVEQFRNEHGLLELRHQASVALTKLYEASSPQLA